MTTFGTMQTRIATELRRSNMSDEIKNAINDAIAEAATTRFYLNVMRGVTFNTVNGTAYYDDMGLVEIDTLYYIQNGARYNMDPVRNRELNYTGAPIIGVPNEYSREGTEIRFDPIPDGVYTMYADGYGKLTPWPLVADADTNNWMTFGERYIRALAKCVLMRDVIRDMREAQYYAAIAEDYKAILERETTTKHSTGTLRSTLF